MIFIASDHAGFELKKKLVEFLKTEGHEVENLGSVEFNPDDDYPDFVYPCALRVAQGKLDDVGIVIGGSGQGEAMVANRVKGVRAAVFYGPVKPVGEVDVTGKISQDVFEILRLTREHNDANILCLGARFLRDDEAIQAVKTWLETKFSGEERHARRIEKIKKLEGLNS